MFTEKNLPRLIIIVPIATIFLLTLFIIYFFINFQYDNFNEDSKELEKKYLQRQKKILVDENKKINDYIDYRRSVNEKHINTYYQKVKNDKFIEKETLEMHRNIQEKKLKKEIIDWIQKIRYGTNGYVWIHNTSHILIAHSYREQSIGRDDTNNTDATGTKIFQQFIKIAKTQKNGGYIEYFWAKPKSKENRKKIGFVKLYKDWNWVIGTGLYIDDIEKSIAKRKLRLKEKIDQHVKIILFIALILMIVFGIISYFVSQYIVQIFTSYQEKVLKKEQALKEFNTMLTTRINEAVEETKRKDQALLHQSRLAQMGEMISMIAHQWRQPLSEISGIFMEMETASKFNKADKSFILRESKDGNRLIEYMSKTIDDFRDFFKPSKSKELFALSSSCFEAATLSKATLKSNHIHLDIQVKKDVKIKGYPSEYAQVILNLILNAKDVLIERKITNPIITIIVDKKDNASLVSLSDNGGGIDEKIIHKIFEPYFSTKKSSGTGLGLYMSKIIIENNMDGKIDVKNQDNGAIFEIRIDYDK